MAGEQPSSRPETQTISSELQQALALDRTIHEPARLVILAALSHAEEVDFKFLEAVTGLTKGNLSRQASNLAEAGYIEIRKYFKGKVPATAYRITPRGREAFAAYWERMNSLQRSIQGTPEQEI